MLEKLIEKICKGKYASRYSPYSLLYICDSKLNCDGKIEMSNEKKNSLSAYENYSGKVYICKKGYFYAHKVMHLETFDKNGKINGEYEISLKEEDD
jgi:hypothetical protein